MAGINVYRRLEALLNSPTGRDFTINTVSGVVFKIHSAMLIGQAKQLEKVAYPVSDYPNHQTCSFVG